MRSFSDLVARNVTNATSLRTSLPQLVGLCLCVTVSFVGSVLVTQPRNVDHIQSPTGSSLSAQTERINVITQYLRPQLVCFSSSVGEADGDVTQSDCRCNCLTRLYKHDALTNCLFSVFYTRRRP